MKQSIFFLFLAAALTWSCGSKPQETTDNEADTDPMVLEGDSTVYGLACDGCTDTILVFLPADNIAADPDTFNILQATRRHRVFGRIKIGDNIAVVRNSKDSTVADFVINMERLGNSWAFQVMPTLHVRADMVGKTEKQILENLPDSIKELLNTPREYILQIKRDHTAFVRGLTQMNTEEDDAVDYPVVKHYGLWHLFNGKLLLTETTIDTLGILRVLDTDTADFVLLDKDTLVLRFPSTDNRQKGELRHFYPKTDE